MWLFAVDGQTPPDFEVRISYDFARLEHRILSLKTPNCLDLCLDRWCTGTSWSLPCTFRARVPAASFCTPRLVSGPCWFETFLQGEMEWMHIGPHSGWTSRFYMGISGRLRRDRWRFFLGGTQDCFFGVRFFFSFSNKKALQEIVLQENWRWTSHQKVLAFWWWIGLQAWVSKKWPVIPSRNDDIW